MKMHLFIILFLLTKLCHAPPHQDPLPEKSRPLSFYEMVGATFAGSFCGSAASSLLLFYLTQPREGRQPIMSPR